MQAAAADVDRVRDPGHLDRHESPDAGAVANLAERVLAPGPHRAALEPGEAVVRAGGDLHRRGDAP